MFHLFRDRCGCGKPATNGGYFCDDCRASMMAAAPQATDVPLFDQFAHQHELSAKLNRLSDNEWRRFTLVGMPSRLQ